jgi:Glycosyl transferases group 1
MRSNPQWMAFSGHIHRSSAVGVLTAGAFGVAKLAPGLPQGLWFPTSAPRSGDGARRERLIALADALGVHSRVRFRGFVSEQDLVRAYQEADVFCIPVPPSCKAWPQRKRRAPDCR